MHLRPLRAGDRSDLRPLGPRIASSKWTAFVKQTYDLVILHEQAIGGALWTVVSDVKARGITVVGVLSDQPSIDGLLDLTRYQLQGYGNSHMSAPLMAQFLKTLGDGQTRFPPP